MSSATLVNILDNSTTVENSDWFLVKGFTGWTLIVTGITADTIQVWESNTPEDIGTLLREIKTVADVTADGTVVSAARYGRLRIKHTVAGGAAVYVDLLGWE